MKLLATFIIGLLSIIIGAKSYSVPLPRGFLAENIISIGGGNFLMSDVPTGNIVLFNIQTNQFYTVVTAPKGRLIQGLAYDSKRDLIIAAGSGLPYAQGINGRLDASANVLGRRIPEVGPGIYFYSRSTGKPFATCNATDSVLIKDVTIGPTGKFAYFTDAFRTKLYKLNLDRLPECQITKIDLPFYEQFNSGTFYTGLATYRNGIIVNSFAAQLSAFVNPTTGSFRPIAEGEGGHGGMRVRGNCAYVVDALNGKINIYQLYKNRSTNFVPSAVRTRTITDPTFDSPTGLAIDGRNVVVTNANFDVYGNTGNLALSVIRIPKIPKGFC